MQLKLKPQVVVIVVAGVIAAGLSGCQKEQKQRGFSAVPVDVEEVTLTDAVMHSELPGRTSAYYVAEVRPQVSGIIQRRLFAEGAEVQEGDSLYQIDPTVYRAALQSAKATLAQAEADLVLKKADAKRSSRLLQTRAVSKQADDAAQAQLKVAFANVLAARAAVDAAEVNLQYTEVKSPIKGRVSLSEVTPGALVTSNQANRLTVVQQLDPIYVDVTQSYEELARLRKSQEDGTLRQNATDDVNVTLTLANGEVYPHKGMLTFKDAFADEITGTVRIRAVFPNPDRRLMPGMFVKAKLVEGVREKVVKIDQKATMRRTNGSPYVYIVNKTNHIESRDIVINCAEGTKWIVDKGLEAGDKVVVAGILKVRPGALVVTNLGQKPPQGKPAVKTSYKKEPKVEIQKPEKSQPAAASETAKTGFLATLDKVKNNAKKVYGRIEAFVQSMMNKIEKLTK